MSFVLLALNRNIRKMASSAQSMSTCYVRSVQGEERLQIQFEFQRETGHSKVFLSDRIRTEPVAHTLDRIGNKVNQFVNKKTKKRTKKGVENAENDSDEAKIDIQVLHKGEPVSDETPLSEALLNGGTLRILGKSLRIEVNAPFITSVKLPESIMVGFPIFPLISSEFCDLEASEFQWTKIKYSEDNNKTKSTKAKKSCESEPGIAEAVNVSSTFSYTPAADDIGYNLRFTCIPKVDSRAGKPFEIFSKPEVMAGPGLCPFEKRHLYTETPTEDGVFRVVSYNILADLYADSDYTRYELFPYCPPYALLLDYRKHLILKELKGYNSDIVCLQEVDAKFYRNNLMSAMDSLGFEGSLLQKGSELGEGSAMFHRRSKFKCLKDHSMLIKDILRTESVCEQVLEKAYLSPSLKEKLETRSSVLHVQALESAESSGKMVLLANTHFYFHPEAGNIRLIHAITCVYYLQKLLKDYQEQGYSTSLVFCGDLNSTPKRGIYEFMTTKNVKEDNIDWKDGEPDMFVEGMNFTHSLNLQSGCGVIPYTNFTGGFKEMLDYIYYDLDTLEVNRVNPPPDLEDLTQHTALPSVVFPSDHIAQICDFAWKF